MHWFAGNIAESIQKAIADRKVFLVLVKGDNDESRALEDLWNDETISEICSEEKCVAINLTAASQSGQQFASIYPILCVPSTYLINSEGMPTDIIPGVLTKEQYAQRLKDGIEKTLGECKTSQSVSEVQVQSSDSSLDSSEEFISKKASDESLQPNLEQSNEEQSLESKENQEEESKKEKAERLVQKVREAKEIKEKEKKKEEENKRRQQGLELTRAKRDMAERQAKKLADEISKQKAEEKAAREKVRQQIARDKAEKQAKYEKEKEIKQKELEKKNAEIAARTEKNKIKVDSNMARIQFRLPDGSTMLKQFNADQKFLDVLNHAKEIVADVKTIRLTTVFPKHEFTEEDNNKTLRELNLVPSASIIISRGVIASSSASSNSLNPLSLLVVLFTSLFTFIKYILSLITGGNSSSSSSNITETERTPSQNNRNENYTERYSQENIRRRPINSMSNIRRLQHDDDDENKTWNGNSTQQM